MAQRLFLLSYFVLPVLGALAAPTFGADRVVAVLSGVLLGIYALHRRTVLAALGDVREPSDNTLWPYDSLISEVRRLRDEADQGSLHPDETDARVLSLPEVWGAISKPDGLVEVFDSILAHLQRSGGFAEAAVLRVDDSGKELGGTWASPTTTGDRQLRRVRWGLGGLSGGIADVLRHPRTLWVDNSEGRPALLVNGERPDFTHQHSSFVAIPLLSPMPKAECFDGGWLYNDDCPAHEEPAHGRGGLAGSVIPGQRCFRCRHYPVHGILVVTDRERGRRLRQSDCTQLEALASSVASILDHALQYREASAAEAFRDQILDAMGNGLLTTDAFGKVVFANRRAQEMTGLGPEMLGRHFDDVIEVLSNPAALRDALMSGAEAIHLDGQLRVIDMHGGNSDMPIRLNLGPYGMGGGSFGAVCVFSDHTGVRSMEEEIRHLDTLAALGRFASSMAHEIRNPLGGISAGLNFIRRSEPLSASAVESFDVINGEIDRLDSIIQNLLEVARPVEMQLAMTDPLALTERCVRSLREWATAASITLQLNADASIPKAYLDGDKIHQILVNLIKNAVEASPEGGTVSVLLRTALAGELEDLQAETPVEALYLSVTNDGTPISDSDLPKLFEPFFTRKPGGTGLGLFVCHNFTERHGGVLRCEPTQGRGARFVLILPRTPIPLGGRRETANSDRR